MGELGFSWDDESGSEPGSEIPKPPPAEPISSPRLESPEMDEMKRRISLLERRIESAEKTDEFLKKENQRLRDELRAYREDWDSLPRGEETLPNVPETQDLVLFLQNRLTEGEKRLAAFGDELHELSLSQREGEAEIRATLEEMRGHLGSLKAAAPDGVAQRIQDLDLKVQRTAAKLEEDLSRRRRDSEDLESRFQRQFEHMWGSLEERGEDASPSKSDLELLFQRQRELLQESFEKLAGTLGEQQLSKDELEKRFSKYMELMGGTWERFLDSFKAHQGAASESITGEALAKMQARLRIHADEIEQRLALMSASLSTKTEDFAKRLESAEASYRVRADAVDGSLAAMKKETERQAESIKKKWVVLQSEMGQLRNREDAAHKSFRKGFQALLEAFQKSYAS